MMPADHTCRAQLLSSWVGGAGGPAQLRLHPYHSLWALLIIALDIFVIWALAAHGRDAATDHNWPPE